MYSILTPFSCCVIRCRCIDDLRRDIANFYVSQLSIALQTSGPPYLGQKLVDRCASSVVTSGDAVSPEQLFPNTYTLLRSVLEPRVDSELAVIKELNEHAGDSCLS